MNPPTSITRSDALRNQVVRLECPSELEEGVWDGPIYARLREPRHIQPGHTSVFVVDDSARRPGWLCQLIFYHQEFDSAPARLGDLSDLATTPVVVPYSRLTRPSEDLSRELRDRPLLLLFRFVRFNSCYLATGSNDYREVMLDVHLTGQVVAYFPIQDATFGTAAGAALRPIGDFMCVVAIRSPVDRPTVHVAIPAMTAWNLRISRDEFMVGWCHGVSGSAQPSRRLTRFRSRWSELIIPDCTDPVLRTLLQETFVPPGSDSTIDLDTDQLQVVTEYGRAITMSPLLYARKYIGPARPATRVDEDVDSDTESPSDLLAIGLSRGRALPRGVPAVARFASRMTTTAFLWRPSAPVAQVSAVTSPRPDEEAPSAAVTTPAPRERTPVVSSLPEHTTPDPLPDSNPPSTMNPSDGVLSAIAELARTTQSVLAQQAAAQQAFQDQLLQRLPAAAPIQHEPPVTRGHGRAIARSPARTRDVHGHRDRRSRHDRSLSPTSRRQRGERRSRSRPRSRHRHDDGSPSANHDHGGRGSPHPRHRFHPYDRDGNGSGNRREPRSPRTRRQSPRRPSSPHRPLSADRSRRGTENAFAFGDRYEDSGRVSPRSQFSDMSQVSRQLHSPASNQAYAQPVLRGQRAGVDLHLRDDGNNPDGQLLLAGTAGFRPTQAELRVHQTARVGPRPRGEFIESNLLYFWQMSALDRVSAILQQETFRGEYRVTKVTAKMIFAVDFGTRPLDHFLPPPTQGDDIRTIVHDSSTWASGDTPPGGYIETIRDLRETLRCIQDVATEWYPEPVANVFAAVHNDSLARLLDSAPRRLVLAMVNLYNHVFTRLFLLIGQNFEATRLVDEARAIMATDSLDYNRFVRHVIDRGLMSTWAQAEAPSTQPPASAPAHRSTIRPRTSSHRSHRQRRQPSSAIPDNIAGQVPQHEGKAICLRFQTQKGCDFRNCKYTHTHVQLPAEVVTYITGKHGPLAPEHPNLRA